MDSLVPIGIIAGLILLNGLFVAAEFSVVGASRAAIEQSARGGRWAARLVRRIVGDPRRTDRFIATAQLGITAASLGLGMYGEHVVASWIAGLLEGHGLTRWVAAHTAASIVAVGVLTYFHIVLGEMVPKSVALQRARATVLGIAPVMQAIQWALYPLVAILNGIGNAVLRLTGIQRGTVGSEHYRSPEELAYVVHESEAGGLLRREAAKVIAELLEFADHTAGEIMVPRVRVVGIPIDAGPERLRRVLRESPHTRYPVYDGTIDEIIGTLHVRDLLRRIAAGDALSVARARPVPFVPATATTDQVLAAMRELGTHMVVVMDEHGGTAGILTMEDLFEEVVGDITERPDEIPEIVAEAPGRARADGAARLEEVGEALGVVLEHEDVDSVSGLVLALLGRPPRVGDMVEYERVRFEVARVRGHGVALCIVTLPEGRQPPG